MKTNIAGSILSAALFAILFTVYGIGFGPAASARQFDTIYSIEQSASALLDDIKKGDLVIIDVQNTIATPKSAMFSASSNSRDFIKSLQERAEKYPNLDQPIARWFLSRRLELVEDAWPDVITKIKEKGALAIGITTIYSGLTKFIKNPEGELMRDLDQIGIKFSQEVISKKYFSLSSNLQDRAYFYEGVLFTGSISKYQTIKNFLRVTILYPGKVFFISTYKPTLRALGRYFKQDNVKSQPILYKGWADKIKDVDHNLSKFQQQLLLKQNVWLEDGQAELKMQEAQSK